MVNVQVRSARETDSSAIKSLIHAMQLNPMDLNWRHFVVAETSDGQFAGCGQVKTHSDGSRELASLAVVESMRKRGVARLIINDLTQNHPRPLYLMCREELTVFYRQFGFEIVAESEMPAYFKRLARLTKMMKSLKLMSERIMVMRLG